MKILAVRGKNIASLDGEFELDFTSEPLASSGIFAIAGPTGAGKSTLLDTMCLALFARTPRTDQAKENEIWLQDVKDSSLTQGDPRNLLRRGTAAGYAEVDFLALNSYRYRARWSVRRARDKESGALQNFRVTLFNLDTRQEGQGTRKELQARIIELIGLTFDQFTRSVLLAQNDFSTFLKADQSEKASLLEKLTGTESFSAISQLIYQKNAQAKEAYNQICNQIGGIELLADEEWQQVESSRLRTEETLMKLNEEKGGAEVKQNWFNEMAALTEGVNEMFREVASTRQAWEDARPRAAYLDLVVQVQGARSIYDAGRKAASVVEEKRKQLETAAGQMNRSAGLWEKARLAYIGLQEEEGKADRLYKSAEPELQRARNLDIRLEEMAKALKETQLRLNKASADRALQETRNAGLREKLKAHHDEITALIEWIEKHRSREHVAGQIAVLQIMLDRAEEARLSIKRAKERALELETLILESDKKLAVAKVSAGKKEKALQAVELKLAESEVEQKKVDPEGLRMELQSARERKERVASAAGCWKELYKMQLEIKRLEQQSADNDGLLTRTEKQQEVQAERLEAVGLRKKQAEQIYNHALLAVAGNVEDIRSQLEENQPCPVCGSTAHPYAGTDTKLHQAFASIREDVQQVSQQYDAELKEAARLKQFLRTLTSEIERGKEELAVLRGQSGRLSVLWEGFNLAECMQAVPEKREGWLEEEQTNLGARIDRLQRQEAQYAVRQEAIRLLQQERMALHQQVTEQNKEYDMLVSNKVLQQNKLVAEQSASGELETVLQTAIQSVNELFGNEKWQAGWIANPQDFRKKLVDFARQWNEKKELLQTRQSQWERLQAEQQTILSYLPSLQKEEDACRQQYEARQKQIVVLNEERQQVLRGRPVTEVEQEFREQRERIKKQLAEAQEVLNNASHVYEQNKGTAAQIDKDVNASVSEAARAKARLDEWLAAFNVDRPSPLTYEGLTELLAKSSEWIQSERSVWEGLNANLSAARAKLKEREEKAKAWEARRVELQIKDETPETLQCLLDQLGGQIRRETAVLSECVFKLRRHAENREKIKNLENELNTRQRICEQWGKLNELAGSSDGGKFRRIAQGYTLDILLNYANVHLRSLSNRYRLERVPDTLALQVIDRDMCDEIRTVHSLSGGESFLVSLGLALGLSSLSSNRMKVESLFIDEGFGSLDADTLRMAMDALESLRTQGRKIGVISHVQEMTERIPVQIRVEKMGNGQSKLSIVG